MKKFLVIIVLSFLWTGTLYSKTLTPWKSKNNVELIWNCSSAKSKFWISFVLNNANPAMVFTSTKGSENIKSMNNLHSIAFRNPESSSNRSFIFLKFAYKFKEIFKHKFDFLISKKLAEYDTNSKETYIFQKIVELTYIK